MPYNTPRTWVAGDVLTAAQLNADVRDNIAFLANGPACRVYRTGASGVSNNVWETLPVFDAERYDNAAMHSTSVSSGRITIPTTGVYLVGGNVEYAANGTGIRGLGVQLNATTNIGNMFYAAAPATFGTAIAFVTSYKFTAGDFIELRCFQNSGGILNVNAVANVSPEFWAAWVGLG